MVCYSIYQINPNCNKKDKFQNQHCPNNSKVSQNGQCCKYVIGGNGYCRSIHGKSCIYDAIGKSGNCCTNGKGSNSYCKSKNGKIALIE